MHPERVTGALSVRIRGPSTPYIEVRVLRVLRVLRRRHIHEPAERSEWHVTV